MWLNFHQSGADTMFLYWPVVLVGLTVLIMFLPAPLIYYRSRQWWAYSNVKCSLLKYQDMAKLVYSSGYF